MLNEINIGSNPNVGGTVSHPANVGTSNVNLNNKSSVVGEKRWS
jgi:hypothetical protein